MFLGVMNSGVTLSLYHTYIHTNIHTILFQHASPNSINMLISMEGVYKNTYKRELFTELL